MNEPNLLSYFPTESTQDDPIKAEGEDQDE